ncbi:MAG: hypothetical protein F6K31_35420 [Symploca sp. SIO2G7]|nr:hypothetical protein [Symploca sp. SIO2G7]
MTQPESKATPKAESKATPKAESKATPKAESKATPKPEPTVTPKLKEPKFGFNEYAERLNGRAAMVGFLLTVVIEYSTGKGLLSWLGLQ